MDSIPKSSENVQDTYNFERLKEQYGSSILAHGVEQGKGGVSNIVMMCIAGKIQVSSHSWDALVDGPPNLSPISHGPYFIIYDIKLSSETKAPNNPSCEDIAYVLVPCVEVADALKEKLGKAKTQGFIDEDTLEKFQRKIVTYDGLYEICSSRVLEESQQKRKRSSESAGGEVKRARSASTFFQGEHAIHRITADAMAAKSPQTQNVPAPQ